MNTVALSSHGIGALLFLALSGMLAVSWRGRLEGGLLLLAALLSTLWLGAVAYQAAEGSVSWLLVQSLEVLRNLAWFTFLLSLLLRRHQDAGGGRTRLKSLGAALYVIGAFTILAIALQPVLPASGSSPGAGVTTALLGHVLLTVGGLLLVEQLFRNTRPDQRWAIKFLCLGIGALFAYDFYLYSTALLFKQLDPAVWSARGAINALVVPLIAVSAKRNADWTVEIFASKRIVFHSATLLGAGAYLLVMAGAGYYIRDLGGNWGPTLQTVFLFGTVILLLVLMFSGQVRAQLKFFLNKHFFGYKYDYRDEWLRFIATLSEAERRDELRESTIRAVGEIVESTGGILWMQDGTGYFAPAARVVLPDPGNLRVAVDSPMVRFLEEREWVIDLSAYEREPETYADANLPDWLLEIPRAWLVVPLMHRERLLGFVVLAESRASFTFNWEDTDLLKMVGRQAGSYLALFSATEALTDARQFEAFNRLSAYVVHDLKNLVAQLSLVVSNAKRHMHNPEFVADAIHTVENAVARMNRLLEQLRKDRRALSRTERVDLCRVLEEVVAASVKRQPRPSLDCGPGDFYILADRDRLHAVLGHLVQNAQEATPPSGSVALRLQGEGERVLLEVADTGTGMDADFIRERLFRPFETTKGNAGMGIGVYESREFVRACGGDIDVESAPGRGTTFRVRFPLAGPLPETEVEPPPQSAEEPPRLARAG